MLRFIQTLLVPFGRAPRWQFWLVLILVAGLLLPAAGIGLSFLNVPPPDFLIAIGRLVPGGIIGLAAFAGAALWLLIMAIVNRLHDRGRSGLWLFLLLLPIAGIAALFANQLSPGLIPIPPEMLITYETYAPLAMQVLGGIAGLIALWLLVECLFLPGRRLES